VRVYESMCVCVCVSLALSVGHPHRYRLKSLDPALESVVRAVRSGLFGDTREFNPLLQVLVDGTDHYLVAIDFPACTSALRAPTRPRTYAHTEAYIGQITHTHIHTHTHTHTHTHSTSQSRECTRVPIRACTMEQQA
jgi:hypothetical protein